jgi:hypothetical protein
MLKESDLKIGDLVWIDHPKKRSKLGLVAEIDHTFTWSVGVIVYDSLRFYSPSEVSFPNFD